MPDLVTEACSLYAGLTRDIPGEVARTVAELRELERTLERRFQLSPTGLDVLDVGAGQRLLELAYFSRQNNAVGIDLDVIVQGFDPLGYVRMARANGAKRAVKTLARKSLLVDRRYRRELARELGTRRIGRLHVLTMDAAAMTFAAGEFDLVHASRVFQHLPDPDAVLAEMVRVLRRGGALVLSLTPFTSPSGSLDVRLLAGTAELPPWAHLRNDVGQDVLESAYVNRLRLNEWLSLFERRLPGCAVVFDQRMASTLETQARELKERGELADYDLDELVTTGLTLTWGKGEVLSQRAPTVSRSRRAREAAPSVPAA